MPRITVTSDSQPHPNIPATFLDERVQSDHLSTGHSAAQLIERLAWAILDAEDSELKDAESLEAKRTTHLVPAGRRANVHAEQLHIRRAGHRALTTAHAIRD